MTVEKSKDTLVICLHTGNCEEQCGFKGPEYLLQ
jgi:hypothetical protein